MDILEFVRDPPAVRSCVQTQVASDWIQRTCKGKKNKSCKINRRGNSRKFNKYSKKFKEESEAFCWARVTVQETLNMPVAARTAGRSKARSGRPKPRRESARCLSQHGRRSAALAAPEYQNIAPRGESEERAVKQQEAEPSRSRFLPVRPINSKPRRLQSAAFNQPVNWLQGWAGRRAGKMLACKRKRRGGDSMTKRPSRNLQECFPVRTCGSAGRVRIQVNHKHFAPIPCGVFNASIFVSQGKHQQAINPSGWRLNMFQIGLGKPSLTLLLEGEGPQANRGGDLRGREHENDHLPRPFRWLCPLCTNSCGQHFRPSSCAKSSHVCSVTEPFAAELLVSCKFLKPEMGVLWHFYQAKLS